MKNKLKSLSLVVAGIVIGVVISYSPEIYAASSKLLGSKVTNTINVKLDNKLIGEAPVINGTSYVPLRTAATELGLEIQVGKEISLTSTDKTTEVSKPTTETPETPQTKTEPVVDNSEKISNLQQQIKTVKDDIASTEKKVSEEKASIENMKSTTPMGVEDRVNQSVIQTIENSYNRNVKYLEVLKKNLAEYESQLAELQK